jgi:ribosomal protein S18 acetylase RimI-like enzyme
METTRTKTEQRVCERFGVDAREFILRLDSSNPNVHGERALIAQHDITLATEADAIAIAQLSRDAIEQGLSWSWTPQRVMTSIHDASTNVIVARPKGGLLGFGIMKYRDDEAHLLLLAVHALHRRSGAGSALLDWLEITAQVAGIASIHLETRAGNGAARAFYRKHHYDEIDLCNGYYEGVEDAVRLVKNLRVEV